MQEKQALGVINTLQNNAFVIICPIAIGNRGRGTRWRRQILYRK